jgi:hypothetical protein
LIFDQNRLGRMNEARERLITAIEIAFSGVSREDGITLHEAEVIDNHGSELQQLEARELDREARWQDVPDIEVEKHPVALSHFDPIAFRYYIPVYMRFVLREPRAGESGDSTIYSLCLPSPESQSIPISLTPLSSKLQYLAPFVPELSRQRLIEYQRRRFEAFNCEQARVICQFLRFIVEYEYAGLDVPVARRAIDRHWGSFCPSE